MGQYYFPTILREEDKKFTSQMLYSHNYDNGLKLMEHSYIGNNFVDTVLFCLYNKPGRLAWMGDYHKPGDIKNAELDLEFRNVFNRYKGNNPELTYYKPEEKINFSHDKFILNHDKKQFVDMRKYCENAYAPDWGGQVHPLPLLTAVGNGRGGGDYWGEGQKLIGSWAGDLIEVQTPKPNGYKDITDKVLVFKEE